MEKVVPSDKPDPRPHHPSSYDSLKNCYRLLATWSQQPNAFEFFYFSGKNWNDLGLWDQCNRDPENRYIKLKFINRTIPQYPFRVGLCVPKQCSASDMQLLAPWFAKRIGSKVGQDFSSFLIKAYDPNQYVAHLTKGSSLFFAIFFGSMLLCMLSAVIISIYTTKKVDQFGKKISFTDQEQLLNNEIKDQPLIEKNYENHIESFSSLSQENVIQNQRKKHSYLIQVIDGFHWCKNFDKLYESPQPETDKLVFLHGVRALSLAWIIWGQEYFYRFFLAANPLQSMQMLSEPIALLVRGSTFAVDVCLWLSGFFMINSLLSSPRKKNLKNPLGFLAAVVYRYLRIVPAYMFVLLFYSFVLKRFGSGPNWYMMENETNKCQETWSRNILMIDNLYNDNKGCFQWGWYLACDFQLFLFSLFFIIPTYFFNKTAGKCFLWICIIASLIYIFILSSVEGFSFWPIEGVQSFFQMQTWFQLYFRKPWTRAPAYLFGVYIGFLYQEFKRCEYKIHKVESQGGSIENISLSCLSSLKNKISNSAITNAGLYLIGLLMINLCLFGPRNVQTDGQWTSFFTIFFLSVEKISFVIGLTLVLLPSLIGFETLLKNLIQLRQLVYISRMALPIYLLHGIIIQRSFYNSKSAFWYRQYTMIYWAVADSVFIWIFSHIVSLLVEYPIINWVKLTFTGQKMTKIE